MPSFNLLTEQWIPVLWDDGTTSQIGLEAVIRDSAKIVRIVGSPLESVTVLRLILAITHQVETPKSLSEWGRCWEGRTLLMQRARKYMLQEVFTWDLLHAEHPFGQIATLQGTVNPAHILIYEAARKNNPIHTDHYQALNPPPVPIELLARGVLVTNAFAGSSGGGYRSGPLCVRSVAIIEGRNIAETIVLNLLVQNQSPAKINWKHFGQVEGNIGQIDICKRYLWTSRAIKLNHDGDAIRTVILAPGNEMPEEVRKDEPMVPYRLDSQGKTWVPLRLEPGQALWRSSNVLLNWDANTKQIASLDQMRRLFSRGILPKNIDLKLRVCAVTGDAKGPSSQMWRDESIMFSSSVLESESRCQELISAISTANRMAKDVRNRIYGFALRYLQGTAEPRPDTKDVNRLVDELSPDLSTYWRELAPLGERIACDGFDIELWNISVRIAADKTFREAVDRLPENAQRFRAEFAKTRR